MIELPRSNTHRFYYYHCFVHLGVTLVNVSREAKCSLPQNATDPLLWVIPVLEGRTQVFGCEVTVTELHP